MIALRYRPFWIVASIVLLAGVVWGSLQTSVTTPTVGGFDKVEHFSTYLLLAVWFTGFYRRTRYWIVALALLSLGATMEVMQFLMHAGRVADPYDMAANTAGVALGLLLAILYTGDWPRRVEAWLR